MEHVGAKFIIYKGRSNGCCVNVLKRVMSLVIKHSKSIAFSLFTNPLPFLGVLPFLINCHVSLVQFFVLEQKGLETSASVRKTHILTLTGVVSKEEEYTCYCQC